MPRPLRGCWCLYQAAVGAQRAELGVGLGDALDLAWLAAGDRHAERQPGGAFSVLPVAPAADGPLGGGRAGPDREAVLLAARLLERLPDLRELLPVGVVVQGHLGRDVPHQVGEDAVAVRECTAERLGVGDGGRVRWQALPDDAGLRADGHPDDLRHGLSAGRGRAGPAGGRGWGVRRCLGIIRHAAFPAHRGPATLDQARAAAELLELWVGLAELLHLRGAVGEGHPEREPRRALSVLLAAGEADRPLALGVAARHGVAVVLAARRLPRLAHLREQRPVSVVFETAAFGIVGNEVP
mmetsp:Transcript_58799/g.152815  ORF Transcript_58799/g.152815 Transcript_58799/m.152815 type:complete len:297 (-) Transcript_58799:121-1011(-)